MLLWKDDVDVTILNYNSTFFYCYMKIDGGSTFHFNGFYGARETSNKSTSWTLFQRFADVGPFLPWIVIGNFNEILSKSNKLGGALWNEAHMDAF
uniref:Uncharacterized protein n=1 Tax=Cannabis sativa TaxID=3483 RepID=A0A803QG60_CANSA